VESQSAGGSTIENFEIIHRSALSASGGVFTSGGGGAFSGALEVDVAQIPPDGSGAEFYFSRSPAANSAPATAGARLSTR
jgi:hypothetical protein